MSNNQVVFGSFEGLFYTNQKVVLSESDKIKSDFDSHINVYEGQIKDSVFLDAYRPEEYKNYDSILLSNASNIEVEAGKGADFEGKQKFEFNQVVLVNPKVLNSWEMNGKTYGKIKSDFLGVTHEKSESPFSGPDKSTKRDPKNPNPDNSRPENSPNKGAGSGNDKTGNSSSKNSSTGNSNGSNGNPGSTSNPPFFGKEAMKNSFSKMKGCLSTIWRILGWLLLLFLLFWLFRMCSGPKKHSEICDQIPKLEKEVERNNREKDSLKKVYYKNMLEQFNNLSKVYFYENSTNELDMSTHSEEEMANFLERYKSLKIGIKGYKNSTEKIKGIDFQRAYQVKRYLISQGVSPGRLVVKGVGANNSIVDPTKLQKDVSGKRFNRNMRAEIFIQSKKSGK